MISLFCFVFGMWKILKYLIIIFIDEYFVVKYKPLDEGRKQCDRSRSLQNTFDIIWLVVGIRT